MKYIIAALALINIYAFILMYIDKRKSKYYGSERISEGMMFFLAAALGSFGVFAGMFVFRHKTRKWHFLVGIPLLMAENLASSYLLYLFLTQVLHINI